VGNELHRVALRESELHAELSPYWRVSVVDVTGSTQTDLAESVHSNSAIDGEVLIANYQSAGRGRLSRTFEAPKNSALLFSFYIQPKRSKEDWGWIALIAGASVAQALEKVKANVKWPNDILVNEKKISGLIAEIVDDGVVIGIGINVGMTLEELPVLTATSLAIEGENETNRNEILAKVLAQFESNFTSWDEGDNSVAQLYTTLSSTLGTKVQIHYPNEKIEKGIAVAISPRGELILDTGSHVQAGDVVHLR